MAEYVDRQAAIEAIDESLKRVFVLPVGKSIMDKIPAADVRPVVKAKWVYTDMSRLVCSNCGNPVAFALKDNGWHHGDFCPQCGARMEES